MWWSEVSSCAHGSQQTTVSTFNNRIRKISRHWSSFCKTSTMRWMPVGAGNAVAPEPGTQPPTTGVASTPGISDSPEYHPVNGMSDSRASVYQATGMISVQLGVGIEEAFVRLRAHAFASGEALAEEV